jgi:hypothetical protein
MSIFDLFNTNSNDEEKDTDSLMDWEKDLVDKGEYEPYNFEEEEMDEEDYYSEDD